MGESVFVSYSHVDRAHVEKLAEHLGSAGFAVWYDHQLSAGQRFDEEIQRQIDACAAFVVVLTPDSVASAWVRDELVYANVHGKPIFPLMLRTCDLPMILIRTQCEDVTSGQMPSAEFVELLRAAVGLTAPPTLVVPTKTHHAVQLVDLIQAGLLSVGTVLLSRKGVLAVVRADGGLDVDGKQYSSPSAAAAALAGTQVNGWTYWFTQDRQSLAALRSKLLSERS